MDAATPAGFPCKNKPPRGQTPFLHPLHAMASLVIRPRSRIFHGHEWIYGTEIERLVGQPQPGDVVTLKDVRNRPMGSAIYNPQSQIVARRISRQQQGLDADFFTRRLERAINLRRRLDIPTDLCRLVWSEADGLPGVIIDVYNSHAVLQTNTLAMDNHRGEIASALASLLPLKGIVERNDSNIRKGEGLPMRTGMLHGSEPAPFEIVANDIVYRVDLLQGQKTGLYLDQLDNYLAVAKHAKDRVVLDCFSNQGGFALQAAKAGAKSVTAVDISGDAVTQMEANFSRNNLTANLVTANVFDYLRELTQNEEADTYDLIILDPPSFTRNRKSLRDALRGYKEIHLRALKLLRPGGILATYTCSHHIQRTDYLTMLVDASVDAKCSLRLLESHTQRRDHPVMPAIPETEYLKGFILELAGGW